MDIIKSFFKRFFYWFTIVARGYSIPMSVLNWLVVFVLTIKCNHDVNILYGLLALVAIVFAHLGTNLFDDVIDTILKVPKQKCKTKYLEDGFTTINKVAFASFFCFLISALIGMFFFLHFGLVIIYLVVPAIILILLYPKLNNFGLGELAIGICFGFLMFAGVNYVMIGLIDKTIIIISLPVSILTITVAYVHSFMDFDFDLISGKRTLCIILKNKKNALYGLMFLYFLTFILSLIIIKNILSILLILLLLPFIINLYKTLYKSIENFENVDFMKNFILARNISLLYNLIIILS